MLVGSKWRIKVPVGFMNNVSSSQWNGVTVEVISRKDYLAGMTGKIVPATKVAVKILDIPSSSPLPFSVGNKTVMWKSWMTTMISKEEKEVVKIIRLCNCPIREIWRFGCKCGGK